MKKKLLIAALTGLTAITLAACSSGSSDKIASMKGATITVEDFYDHVKNDEASSQAVQEMIIYKVFEDAYGDDVTDKEVDKQFNETKKQMGDQFETALSRSNLTEKSYKALIKQQLAFNAGLEAHVDLTDEDLKTAWESFHPEVEVQVMTAASEEDAKALKEAVEKDDADFAKIAKEDDKNTDTTYKEDGGTAKFDSQSTDFSATVKTAAFDLKDGEVSDVISDVDQTYGTTYYVIKMVKNTPKGNDMDKYKDELEEIATATYVSDSAFQNKVIGEELKKANVKITDDTFADVLSPFIDAAEASSTAESESETAASTTAESDSAASSTKESAAESSTAASTEESTTESSK